MKKLAILLILLVISLLAACSSSEDNEPSPLAQPQGTPILETLTITTLVDNLNSNVGDELEAEWGLSIHIEMNGTNILFDTGYFGNFKDNAEKLGIDIGEVDLVVISHAHQDHTGGLKAFFEANEKADVYIREKAKEGCYGMVDGVPVYSGIDKDVIRDYEHRFHLINEFTEIHDSVYVITQFDQKYPPSHTENLVVQMGDQYVPDTFEHEQLLVLDHMGELIVFSGCGHHGILNMIDAAVRTFPDTPIKSVIGGFHLMNPLTSGTMDTPEEIRYIADSMLEYSIQRIFTMHCTDPEAYDILKEVLGETLGYCATGSVVAFQGSGGIETHPSTLAFPPTPSESATPEPTFTDFQGPTYVYDTKYGNETTGETSRVIGEGTLDGVDCYVLENSYDVPLSVAQEGTPFKGLGIKIWLSKATWDMLEYESFFEVSGMKLIASSKYTYGTDNHGAPFSVGKKWSHEQLMQLNPKFLADSIVASDMEVIALEDVTVPAGTFRCYKVETTRLVVDDVPEVHPKVVMVNWWSADHDLLRVRTENYAYDQPLISELVSYTE